MAFTMTLFKIVLLTLGLLATLSICHVEALEGERINNGYRTTHEQFPYQVRIINSFDDGEYVTTSLCSGSILDEHHIITAAHCVVDSKKSPYPWSNGSYIVVAGVNNFKETDRSKWVSSSVQKIYIPKLFRDSLATGRKFTEGDIAILKLEESLNFGKNGHLDRVFLPYERTTYTDELALVSGYGKNQVRSVINEKGEKVQNNTSDGSLRFAYVSVLSNGDCRGMWYTKTITSRHICAEVDKKDINHPLGICGGDSGGPLTHNNFLIGVVNAGSTNCIENESPGVYARITAYKDFIEKAQSDTEDLYIQTMKPPVISWKDYKFETIDD